MEGWKIWHGTDCFVTHPGAFCNKKTIKVTWWRKHVQNIVSINLKYFVVDVEAEIESKMSKDGHLWYCYDCSYKSNKKSNKAQLTKIKLTQQQ